MSKKNNYYQNYDEDNQCPYQPDQQTQTSVSTPFGTVKKVSLNSAIPEGWRKLKLAQGQQIKTQLNTLLQQWSIVAFEEGKLDGYGYGNKFHPTYGNECGEVFIVNANAP